MATKPKKEFDCIKMKRDIQAKLYRRWKGLTTVQIADAIRKDLAESDDPLAVWWRSLSTAADRESRKARQTPPKKQKR